MLNYNNKTIAENTVRTYLKPSMAACMCSIHHDLSSPDNFYNSYILRKQSEIKRLTIFLQQQDIVGKNITDIDSLNRKKYLKLRKNLFYFKLATDYKTIAMKIIRELLANRTRVVSPRSWFSNEVCDLPNLN